MQSRRVEGHRIIRPALCLLHTHLRRHGVHEQIDNAVQVHSQNIKILNDLVKARQALLNYLRQVVGIYVRKVVNRAVVIQVNAAANQVDLDVYALARHRKHRLSTLFCSVALQGDLVLAAADVRARFPLEVDRLARRQRGKRLR